VLQEPPPFHYNQPLPNMPNRKKEFYCGDTVNTLGREDHAFQWSEAFKWYTTLPLEENNSNKVRTFGITLAGSMPEVSYFKEIILWCVDNFNNENRIIQL
jgi:hypothetical protein